MKKEEENLIEKAMKCLEKAQDRETDNIKRAEDAIRFRALEQWPDEIKRDRENPSQDGGPRPCPVLDKTNQYVRQIVNEERQNRAAIKIRPVDDEADIKVAEVYTGIIRHIEDQSEAIEAYSTAGEHAIDGGFGYWRLLTEYSDPMSFEQDIKIKRIPNRFSVALGPHKEVDGSDAKEGIIWEDIPSEEFKSKYPKAKEVSFDDTWGSEETIRVAEYMCIKPETFTLYMLENGEITTNPRRSKVLTQRTSQINKVKWYKITSAQILEQEDMLGSYIPIVKVIGNELTMPDGKTRLSGALEAAMDPQRLHNYAHAGFIENVALAPRAPWIAEETSIEGFEEDYEQANRRNITVLKYKATEDGTGNLVPRPDRIPPAGISPGWQQMLLNTDQGVQSTFGMYGPSVGRESQEKSGIALQEQKVQGMIGNFHFPDNLSRSIQHTGRILLEWIPKVYDTERAARILGVDGETEMVYLNPDQESPIMDRLDEMNQPIGSVYNLSVGKYDVTVTTGPSYTSKRQEAFDNLSNIISSRPDLMEIIGDLVFKNMDAPYADDIAERMRTLLPPPIQQMLDKENPVDPQVMAKMQEIEQASQLIEQKAMALQEAEKELEEEANKTADDRSSIDNERTKLDAQMKIFKAEVEEQLAKVELAEQQALMEIGKAKQDLKDTQTEMQNADLEGFVENISESINGLGEGIEQGISGANEKTGQVGQMLSTLANSVNKVSEMDRVTQSLMEQSEAMKGLIEQLSRPKTAKMSDGRIITVQTDTQ